ncbi:MAG: NAD(+) synthase [Pirellulales bacterium]|nr:NAD(+) synthase [Pirellulales bacterium]
MPLLRVGAAALNLTPLDWEGNCRQVQEALETARTDDVGILCLPELCLSGYGCEDMFLAKGVRQTASRLLAELVPESTGLFTSFGLPIEYCDKIYNAVVVVANGKILGVVCKQHLAGDGIHYEPRWFSPWPAGKVERVEIGGDEVPIGDLLFRCSGIGVGFEICRDAWVGDCRPGHDLSARGADILLNPSASHFAFGKHEIREGYVLDAVRDYGVAYAYANLLGNESGRAIYDGGTLLANQQEIVARGPRFSFADVVVTSVGLEIGARRKDHECPQPKDHIVQSDFILPNLASNQETKPRVSKRIVAEGQSVRGFKSQPAGCCDWEQRPLLKHEEFARAVPLGLFDYLRKSRASGFVVSLSGGVDSATTAVMVYLMTRMAIAEVGGRGLSQKLSHVPKQEGDDPATWVASLLACVYQATSNSSLATRQAAQEVAKAIGSEFLLWDVEGLVQDYVQTVSGAVGYPLSWKSHDIALQNIQARSRGPGAWMLANLRGALLLTTSNRSESAVGYATMDGDTCGGLAPIAGVDKAFLRDWLAWMETTGPSGLGPVEALAAVNCQPPTAELRPPATGQTDEADLMPYRVLDRIERAAIRDKQMPVEVFETVCRLFPGYEIVQIGTWVEQFYQLWCRNQWKRERYAPSFHLDDENLDPKTWCRFPILSGGFERELKELRAHIAKRVDSSVSPTVEND